MLQNNSDRSETAQAALSCRPLSGGSYRKMERSASGLWRNHSIALQHLGCRL